MYYDLLLTSLLHLRQGLLALDFEIKNHKGSKRRVIAPFHLGGGCANVYRVSMAIPPTYHAADTCISPRTGSLRHLTRDCKPFLT